MRQPNWQEYEVVLLIDTYFRIQRGEITKEDAISELSSLLRQIAVNKRVFVDSVYRNKNGISFRLAEIEYLFSDGKEGISHTSELFRSVVSIYKNDPKRYMEMLMKAKELVYNLSIVSADDPLKKCKSNSEVPFYLLFGVDYHLYLDDMINTDMFSQRNYNALRRMGIESIGDLLCFSYIQLVSTRNLGKKSIEQIIDYLYSMLHPDSYFKKLNEQNNDSEKPFFSKFIQQILDGDFSFIDENSLSETEVITANKFREAFDVLGRELVNQAFEHQPAVLNLISALYGFCEHSEVVEQAARVIKGFKYAKPWHRINTYVDLYSKAYPNSENLFVPFKGYTFEQLINPSTFNSVSKKELLSFLQWCDFDIEAECNSLFECAFKKERDLSIIQMRANKATLNEIGNQYGFTRERVRQIESKILVRAGKWDKKHMLLYRIAAIRNDDYVLTSDELRSILGSKANEVLYMFSQLPNNYQTYDKELDVFLLGGKTGISNVKRYVEYLPDAFSEKEFDSYVKKGMKRGIPAELLEKEIHRVYNHSGTLFHKGRLSITFICVDIVEEFFPDGIHIYDTEEIETFKEKAREKYGNIKLPSNDRALQARIADKCILRDRGTYIAPERCQIPHVIVNRIYNYIKESKEEVFFMGYLFKKFETQLIRNGVDNRYYLQGILKSKFDGKLFIKKDYVSKNQNVLSLAPQIFAYICEKHYPVTKKQLLDRFLIAEITLNFLINDMDVLNYFGKYISYNNLRYENYDVEYLTNTINKMIDEEGVVHCNKIYDFLIHDNKDLLNKLFIDSPYALFSFLEYCLADKFEFSRPCINLKGKEIGLFSDYIITMFEGEDIISIDDIMQVYRDHHQRIVSKLSVCEVLEETHVLNSRSEIVSFSYAGITPSICEAIENIIKNNLEECIPISYLDCIMEFPKINVSWNEWLIYGTLKKWATEIDIALTSNVLSDAIPLVAPKGTIKEESIKQYEHVNIATDFEIDDLDDIESLIEDEIEFELEELDEL